MHPRRWPLIRHVYWCCLVLRYTWWWHRHGKYRTKMPTAYADKYLDDVWEGRG